MVQGTAQQQPYKCANPGCQSHRYGGEVLAYGQLGPHSSVQLRCRRCQWQTTIVVDNGGTPEYRARPPLRC